MKYFETRLLDEVNEFIKTLDSKTRKKIFFNIRIAEQTNDPRLFKKLNSNIWEFRAKYQGTQFRLLAFWDKTETAKTLVLACNGFIKKSKKTPKKEIRKAEQIRLNYFNQKKNNF